ncbi:MAG: cyclophilin-like fold protein [Chitinophagaceae bacterium]
MKIISAFALCLICIQLYACNNSNEIIPENNSNNITNTDTMKMKITIGTNVFTASLFNNATATALKAKLPMTINMTELNGNEKYFDLSDNLPASTSNPGTIQTGDLMLYGSNTLVLFYKTFSTRYNYTRIGRIDNPSGLAAALGSGNIPVTFESE